jgi:hypothetical protein
MAKAYDPRKAFLGMKAGMKQLAKQAKREEVPMGLVGTDGSALTPSVSTAPATCCVLLLALAHRSPMVPDDFHNVPRTKAGIESYVRPDGAIYLGAYELPNDPGGVVLVYGDPAMTQEQAVAASLAYRKKLNTLFTERPQIMDAPASPAPLLTVES